jgi:hypothetical protein
MHVRQSEYASASGPGLGIDERRVAIVMHRWYLPLKKNVRNFWPPELASGSEYFMIFLGVSTT